MRKILPALALSAALAGLAAPAASARSGTVACPLPSPQWTSTTPEGGTTIPPYTYHNNLYSPSGDAASVTCVGQNDATPQWGFQASVPNTPGHVQGYPSQWLQLSGARLSAYTALTLQFAQKFTAAAGTTEESAVDLWLNGTYADLTSTEVMVWTHEFGTYKPGGAATGKTLKTASGTYAVYYRAPDSTHHSIVTFVRTAAQDSGKVPELTIARWVASHPAYSGGAGSNPVVTSTDYGVELFGTNDAPVTWTDTDAYTVTGG